MAEYYVEIVKYGEPEKVVERFGPMSERKADRVDTGININLNHELFFTRTIEAETR
jgi:hypothetical protein